MRKPQEMHKTPETETQAHRSLSLRAADGSPLYFHGVQMQSRNGAFRHLLSIVKKNRMA